jgi:dihydrofolate reductase
MNVYAIVACSKNRAIGRDNQIPWYLPADLKYFKKVTSGHCIIMGRKTFESIGRALPKRINIVVSRNPDFKAEGVLVFSSFLEAVEYAVKEIGRDVFVIGGGEIYRQAMSVSKKIYYTEVDIVIDDATVFFPEMNLEDWDLVSEECFEKDENNPFDFCFRVYERTGPITVLTDKKNYDV